MTLSIPPAAGAAHDLLALGALVTRLDPGIVPFAEADDYRLHVSGGEFNVAANLSTCFGMKTAIASAIVNYPIGRRVENAVRKTGTSVALVKPKLISHLFSRLKTTNSSKIANRTIN